MNREKGYFRRISFLLLNDYNKHKAPSALGGNLLKGKQELTEDRFGLLY